MEKRYLFTPGPTPVPREVFRTSDDVLVFSASGTGAMESAVFNLAAPGDTVAVVSHGSFGERWVKICEQHGLDVHPIRYEWGESPDPEAAGSAVREAGAELVFCQHSDTSTGV